MARFRLGLVGISLVAACMEAPPPPPQTPQPVPAGYAYYPPGAVYQPSNAVRRLGVYVNPPADPNANQFRATLIEHFVRLGYRVNEAPTDADVTVSMAFSVSPHPQPAYIAIGPPRPRQQRLDLHVTLTAAGGGMVLGSSSGTFIFGDPLPPGRLDALCLGVMAGPRVEDFARGRGPVAATGGLEPGAAVGGPAQPEASPVVPSVPPPAELAECDGDECTKGNPGTWIFHGMKGVGRQTKGQVYDLTVERYDPGSVVIRRVDRPSSTGAGVTMVYYGTVHDDEVSGTATLTWPGHLPNMRPPGVLSGIKWFAKPPQTTCSDGAGLSIQDLTETGGLAVRFQHPSSALECFLIAARRADAPARALVGIMYRDGIGTAVNYREAVDWLKKSAVQDEYNGQLALAQMYEVGMGVRADPEQGRYWRQRAQQNPAYLQQLKNEAQAEKNQERAERREQHTQDMMFMGMAAVLTGVVAAF